MVERPNLNPESTQWRRWAEIDDLFSAALDIEPSLRQAFLSESCRHDPELHRTILELLELSESRDRLTRPGDSLVRAAWERSRRGQ